jgi:hypothetical protein
MVGCSLMELTQIIQHYWPRLLAQPACTVSNEQRSAVNALLGCRTGQYGTLELACRNCAGYAEQHLACGHRFCSRCQHHHTRQWIERQQQKLLPVHYFMVTFTLPYELRSLAKQQPKIAYTALFQSAVSTLKDFGQNHPKLQAGLGLTAVLHTHSRRLDYHPHVHVVVPGGGVHRARKEWRKLKGNYLFNGKALAKVFRARMLAALKKENVALPATPRTWVTHCQDVGYGDSAIKYLSRYLYRGVISNKRIISDDGTRVTFQYTDSSTNTTQTRTLPGEDFLKLILQHVLPKGFRRVRDYGFLHGNAKALLKTIQWVLRVSIAATQTSPGRTCFVCPHCQQTMVITRITKPKAQPG